jgi:hypothetical protein
MRGISFDVSPIRNHAFFKKPQFQCLFGNDFFQIMRFTAQGRNLPCGSRPSRITGKTTLASLKKLLRPLVIDALGDTFAPAKFDNAFLTTQSVQHDADLLFRRILLTRCTADIFDYFGRTGLACLRFLSHLRSPSGHYDEPEILSYAIPLICPIGADVRQSMGRASVI